MNVALTIRAAARRKAAARLGTWVFLASESLLFAGLFALYAGYRARFPVDFQRGVSEMDLWLGSTNTLVLLTSSLCAALAVHAARAAHPGRAAAWLLGAVGLGAVFLVVKGTEYSGHLAAGYGPEGPVFWVLYYAMTGLHAVHVGMGMGVLSFVAFRLRRGGMAEDVVENTVDYWHLVDVIWLFLWPLFYLVREV